MWAKHKYEHVHLYTHAHTFAQACAKTHDWIPDAGKGHQRASVISETQVTCKLPV